MFRINRIFSVNNNRRWYSIFVDLSNTRILDILNYEIVNIDTGISYIVDADSLVRIKDDVFGFIEEEGSSRVFIFVYDWFCYNLVPLIKYAGRSVGKHLIKLNSLFTVISYVITVTPLKDSNNMLFYNTYNSENWSTIYQAIESCLMNKNNYGLFIDGNMLFLDIGELYYLKYEITDLEAFNVLCSKAALLGGL